MFPHVNTMTAQLYPQEPLNPGGSCSNFYPNPGVLSPATMAGTDQWLHPVPMYATGTMGHPVMGQQAPVMAPLPIPFPPQNVAMGPAFTSSSNSPLLLTDISGSSCSGGTRSAVISPSETSSMSSDLPAFSRSFKCLVCNRHFGSPAQLHCHLQAARHYKNDGQQFYSGKLICKGTGTRITGNHKLWITGPLRYNSAVCPRLILLLSLV